MMQNARSCSAISLALPVLLALAAPVGAADYELQTLAGVGEPAPVEGTFDTLSGFDVSAAGRVVFWGYYRIGNGNQTGAIYLHEDGATTRVANQGDPSPGGPGLTYLAFGAASLNDADEVAIHAIRSDGLQLLVVRSAQGDRIVALEGEPAPGPVGATWRGFASRQQLDDDGSFLFFAEIDTPAGTRKGWFLESGGAVEVVYLEGDPAPAPVGGTYSAVSTLDAALSGGGLVHFVADLAGGSVPSALFRFQAGSVTPLFLEGDPVPTPRGGIFDGFILVAASGGGKVGVRSLVRDRSSPFPFTLGLALVLDGTDFDEVVAGYDPIPGTASAFVGTAFEVVPNDAGDVAIVAAMQDDDGLSRRVVLATRSGELVPVVFEEGSPNASDDIGFFQLWEPAIDAAGRVVFSSSVAGGSGIFLATPVAVSVPAVGPGGIPLLGALLLAAAFVALQLRRA